MTFPQRHNSSPQRDSETSARLRAMDDSIVPTDDSAPAGAICSARFHDLIQRYVEKDLSPAEKVLLFEHLDSCEACCDMLEAEERLTERLKAVPRLIPSSDLRASIMAQFDAEMEDLSSTVVDDERFSDSIRGPATVRKRAILGRMSPTLAFALVLFGTLATLYTSDFSDFAPLNNAQLYLRNTVAQIRDLAVPKTMMAPSAPVSQPPGAATALAPAEGEVSFPILPIEARAEDIPPLLASVAVRFVPRMNETRRDFLRAAGNTNTLLSALANTAAADQAATEAGLANGVTILMIPTDVVPATLPAQSGLADLTQSMPAGKSSVISFRPEPTVTLQGQRFRACMVEAQADWLKSVSTELATYRQRADSDAFRGLVRQLSADAIQQGIAAPSKVLVYSAPHSILRQAVTRATNAPGTGDKRTFRLIIAEK